MRPGGIIYYFKRISMRGTHKLLKTRHIILKGFNTVNVEIIFLNKK